MSDEARDQEIEGAEPRPVELQDRLDELQESDELPAPGPLPSADVHLRPDASEGMNRTGGEDPGEQTGGGSN